MNEILDICKRAKAACGELLRLDSKAKFEILNAVADELLAQKDAIKAANAKDLANGEKSGLSAALLDRLRLTDARIEAMARRARGGGLCRGRRRKSRRLEPSKRHANQPRPRAAGGAWHHL